ncbi:hypothetical protein ACKVE0_03810 [Acinetobacter albensis]|uniref:Uncharacterized protein n=1 Tax=Acinetobacter albensis TaxID=1673609 RepID=A0ABW9JQD2_9GAMM
MSQWNPIFLNIPVEILIYQNQKAYCYALQPSTDRGDSAQFIEFILQMILNAIVASSASDQVKHLIEKMEYKVNENMSL